MEKDFGRITVALYTAVPSEEQFRRVRYPWPSRLKGKLKTALNAIATKITGRLFFDSNAYKVARGLGDNSNRGDIAIRMAVRAQLVKASAPRTLNFVEVGWGHLNDETVARINESCDLFVISGGGYIFLNGDGSGGARFADIPLLRKLRCRVVAFGIGLNRLTHEQTCSLGAIPNDTQEKIRSLSAACQVIAVRDRDTLELFSRYGERPAILTGDPVLYFGKGKTSRPRPEGRSLKIGVNLAAHGWRSLSVLKPLLPQIADFLLEIQSRWDIEFVYLMHHDFERPLFLFLRSKGLRMGIVDGTATDLLSAYSGIDFVINQMLHSCIFASCAGVPFLNIAYDLKSVAFCSLMEIPECAVTAADATATVLRDRFDGLFERRGDLSRRIVAVMAKLDKANGEFLERLVESRHEL